VNPTQFRPGEDPASYPRDESRDAALPAGVGVDVLFAPPMEEVYPPGFATTVRVRGVTESSRGPARRRALRRRGDRGDETLQHGGPDVAYFGQKDVRQALAIRRLVPDLDIPP
jgi:pantoate--beta-alanine ligase